MNWLTKYILRRICRKIVIQGIHKGEIKEYYSILKEELEKVFTEDNERTIQAFLEECHKNS